MDVLALLNTQNRCLDKAVALSRDFIADLKAQKDALSLLDPYEQKRSHLFKAIDLFDRKITETVTLQRSENSALSENEKSALRVALHQREKLLAELQQVDGLIMEALNQEALQVSKEIQSTRKSREMIGKFKSRSSAPGSEVDQSL
jgi:hypothetical protein